MAKVRPAVYLVLGGVSLYLLLPSLPSVFGSWRSLSHLDWPFAILALACEIASYVCLWEVDRIALGTPRVVPCRCRQLTGFSAGHVLPGGGATSTATAVLRRARHRRRSRLVHGPQDRLALGVHGVGGQGTVIADQSTRPPGGLAWIMSVTRARRQLLPARLSPRVYRRLAACHGLPSGSAHSAAGTGGYVTLSSSV